MHLTSSPFALRLHLSGTEAVSFADTVQSGSARPYLATRRLLESYRGCGFGLAGLSLPRYALRPPGKLLGLIDHLFDVIIRHCDRLRNRPGVACPSHPTSYRWNLGDFHSGHDAENEVCAYGSCVTREIGEHTTIQPDFSIAAARQVIETAMQ